MQFLKKKRKEKTSQYVNRYCGPHKILQKQNFLFNFLDVRKNNFKIPRVIKNK